MGKKNEAPKKLYKFSAANGKFIRQEYDVASIGLVDGTIILKPVPDGAELRIPSRWVEDPRAAELWTRDPDEAKAYTRMLCQARDDERLTRGRLETYSRILGQVESAKPESLREHAVQSGQEPPVLEVIVKGSGFEGTVSLEALAGIGGVDAKDIESVWLRLTRGSLEMHAAADAREADYPGITVDASTPQAGDIWLGNFEMPCGTYPSRIAARLYAGCHAYETDEPIAIVTHEVTDDARVIFRSDNYGHDGRNMKKLVYVDYKEADTRSWADASEESMPEHREDEAT